MSFRDFYDNHLKLLEKKDATELVKNDYHEDAMMILHITDQPIILEGREAITQQLDGYIKYIYRGFISTEKYAETADSIFFEATIETVNGPSKVYDALFMKDNKIFRHFSGLKG